ncbi:MAG: alpha-amylase family glycosyl hydrolase, partial [Sphingomonas sp.]
IGLSGHTIPPDRIRDPQKLREPHNFDRDEARTPMPWTNEAKAGFTTGEPWLPLDPDHGSRNVAAQSDDPASQFTLVRHLLALRRAEPALQTGAYRELPGSEAVLAYERIGQHATIGILLNLTDTAAEIALPDGYADAEVLLAARAGDAPARLSSGRLILPAHQGLIVNKGTRP